MHTSTAKRPDVLSQSYPQQSNEYALISSIMLPRTGPAHALYVVLNFLEMHHRSLGLAQHFFAPRISSFHRSRDWSFLSNSVRTLGFRPTEVESDFRLTNWGRTTGCGLAVPVEPSPNNGRPLEEMRKLEDRRFTCCRRCSSMRILR